MTEFDDRDLAGPGKVLHWYDFIRLSSFAQ